MYASTIVALFAVAVVARPQVASSLLPRDVMQAMTLGQAQNMCGANMEVSCCNKDQNTSNENSEEKNEVLSKLLPDLNVLGGECDKISVTALIGVNDPLNKQCSGNVACCDRSSSNASGLVAVAVPCLALGSVL